LDDDKDRQEPRRAAGSNVVENSYYRLLVDRGTGRVTLFDKELSRDVCRDMEVVGTEERGGNYIGLEPLSGRTLLASLDKVTLEENNPVRAVMRVESRIADIMITQRFTLPKDLKRLDIENTIEWKTPRFVRIEQLFPMTQTNYTLQYGIPFGACSTDDVMPNTGPRAGDEIKPDSWRSCRLVHDWIYAGSPDWGLNVATDHQQIRLNEGIIRAEMLRGTRYTSVKVVRGDQISSLFYPPPGTYTFRYSLSSAKGDWKKAKAYRAGMNWNNPLLPVSVVDTISTKTLPPTHSFCSIGESSLVLSSLKKADLDGGLTLRAYEIEGSPVETPVEFLGRQTAFTEVNFLEEKTDADASAQILKASASSIKTLKFEWAPTISKQAR
jgi:alpha-mannosidase